MPHQRVNRRRASGRVCCESKSLGCGVTDDDERREMLDGADRVSHRPAVAGGDGTRRRDNDLASTA